MRFYLKLILVLVLVSGIGADAAKKKKRSTFDLGRQAFESGRYVRALSLFDRAIGTAKSTKDKNLAYYFQGLVLYEKGYYYSSYLSFRNVLLTADRDNKQVYEKAIKNAVIIMDRLQIAAAVGKVLSKLPSDLIPSSVGHMANYAIGNYYFGKNKNKKAASRFKSVHPKSQFYPKALFHLGVLATKEKNYKDAAFYFMKVVKLTQNSRSLKNLNQLARLNISRTVYSAGDMERSIELYSKFTSASPYWLTILLEASWPLMRVSDTTVSMGNLHTVISPFYREDLVGEAYLLRTTILFALCKYEEMRRTLQQFFQIYDPVMRDMQAEKTRLGSATSYYNAFINKKGLNQSFMNYANRDPGIKNAIKVQNSLRRERSNLAKHSRNSQLKRARKVIRQTVNILSKKIGLSLRRMHRLKLKELLEQREQANYLRVEIVTGEKDLIESQKGLPPKRVTDVETTVSESYHFWPFQGEYWEDELGAYVYTTESACIN